MVKMLTAIVSTESNSQVFLLKNSKNIPVYAIFNDQRFNDTLTNDIVSFEQLGPDIFFVSQQNVHCGKLLEAPW